MLCPSHNFLKAFSAGQRVCMENSAQARESVRWEPFSQRSAAALSLLSLSAGIACKRARSSDGMPVMRK